MSAGSPLATTLCGISLKNPVIAASGTFGYGIEFEKLVDLNALGGLVVKGLSREPIEGNPEPRLLETRAGMINSVGLQNVGVRAFVKDKLPRLAKFQTAVFANIFGYATEDYAEVVRVLEDAPGIAGYELNVSCPNTRHGGIYFSSDPALLAEVVTAVRTVAHRPLIVKLSPNVAAIEPLAKQPRRPARKRSRSSIRSSRSPWTRAHAARASVRVSAASPDPPSNPSRCAWSIRPHAPSRFPSSAWAASPPEKMPPSS